MGYHLNCLDEPVFIAGSKPLLNEFGIHLRLESCVSYKIVKIKIRNIIIAGGGCFEDHQVNPHTFPPSGHYKPFIFRESKGQRSCQQFLCGLQCFHAIIPGKLDFFSLILYSIQEWLILPTTLQSKMNAKLSQQKVLTLLLKRPHQDDSNDTPQPICECQVDFPLLWIKDYPGLS